MAKTKEKTLTLRQFEKKYSDEFIRLAQRVQGRTLRSIYRKLAEGSTELDELKNALRTLDLQVNVNWPLQHYKTAVAYLAARPNDIRSTGGTNWQQYLPPRFQKRIFFPELWTEKEQEEWGKSWVEDTLSELRGQQQIHRSMNWVKAFYLIGIPCFLLHACATDAVQAADDGPSEEEPPKKPKMEFGLVVDSLEHSTHSIRFGETFSGILDAAGVDRQTQFRIQSMGSEVFDPARIQEGKTIHFYRSVQDSAQRVRHMVYAESALTYVRIDLKRQPAGAAHPKGSSGSGTHSEHLDPFLSLRRPSEGRRVGRSRPEVADLYAWSIDFFRLQKGDALVVAYDERFVDDSVRVGLGNIRFARFRHADKNFDAYRMESDGRLIDYYDEEGRSLRKAFLKSPLGLLSHFLPLQPKAVPSRAQAGETSSGHRLCRSQGNADPHDSRWRHLQDRLHPRKWQLCEGSA